jgi:hypothetical protein
MLSEKLTDTVSAQQKTIEKLNANPSPFSNLRLFPSLEKYRSLQTVGDLSLTEQELPSSAFGSTLSNVD